VRDRLDPQSQNELLDWFRRAPHRMPRTREELFQLLATYNPRQGWETFVETIDFSNVTPRQIDQVVLGRPSASASQAISWAGYDPARHFRDALVSREFRQRFLTTFLAAYRLKPRDVFIHVPKCAGTDLILNLGARTVPLPKMLEIEGWIGDSEFIEIVAGLARTAASAERLFVYGHMALGQYVDAAGIRPDDSLFTVLRDPIDLMISQANYAIGRLRQDPTGQQPDTADHLRLLGLARLPDRISLGELKDLAIRALLNPLIAEANRACFYLGRGEVSAFAGAFENLIVHNVEVTTTRHYDRWLRQRWGIVSTTHHNRSDPILPNNEARRLCGVALAVASAEDQKLYDLVSWALQQTATASITGPQIAELIGAPLARALAANTCPALPSDPQAERLEKAVLVAESDRHVEMYLAPVSIDDPAVAKSETVLSVGYGQDAGGDRYRVDGWAWPEREFTWTAASASTIQLPTLRGKGYFVVRLVVGPFVDPQFLPFQQVELLLDDVRIGACQVRTLSVLEVEVPPELVTSNNHLLLTLRLPTAARPSDIGSSRDDRQLALAVHSMAIIRYSAEVVHRV
jgi:hypothetical protein